MGGMDAQDRLCPVCWEEDAYDARGEILGVGCERRHAVCMRCARKLAHVGGPCGCKVKSLCYCTGIELSCPLCRCRCRLQPRHVIALVKGSWESACESAVRQSPENARHGIVMHAVAGC
jgi:hypothetical protein